MKPKILVTAAAGKTGDKIVTQLLRENFPVRAMVRQIDRRSKALAKMGAEIVVGEMQSIPDMRIAMNGCQRAYWCTPLEENPMHKMAVFAIAAAEAKIEHIVHISQWLSAPEHPAFATSSMWLMDQLLDWVPGATLTINNTGWFADNYSLVMLPMAQLGMMPMPLGEGQNAPPSNEDIAAVSVGALINPDDHAGKTYRPTGPTLLTPQEIADAFGKSLGRSVKYDNASERMFLKAMKAQERPELAQSQLRYYLKDYQAGAFAHGAPTNAVLNVTGREPEDFQTIADRYVKAMPEARITLPNRIRAINFVRKMMMAKPMDPAAFEKEQKLPSVRNAQFAMENSAWLQTHRPSGAFDSGKIKSLHASTRR